MKLVYEKVYPDEQNKLSEVYEIIKNSGEKMFKEKGLIHWRTPYPIENIKIDCKEREVFLAKNTDTNSYVHTFQLEFLNDDLKNSNSNNKVSNIVVINKFATLPQYAGCGIGKQSINYIEKYCLSRGVSNISLEVYDKSKHAIRFYKKRGFVVTGSKSTRHFTVSLMEKQL
ncbi:GNAT family N-acetyltransferase [Halobacillus hunanensis]|uniref:GNAT family N-acetyltransferase n=1 Tax=Halobacillus hunanensis TaxID=578214 RepID=UPI0009A5A777|nr:GNAT family N-acetyltransferase [Halobacillus hunanensis]